MMWGKAKIEEDGGFTVPQEILDSLQLKDGDLVTYEAQDGYLVLRKATEPPSDHRTSQEPTWFV